MRIRFAVLFLVSFASIACATAQDDGVIGTKLPRDGGHDGAPDDTSNFDSSSPQTDSGHATDSGSTGTDTYVAHDTYVPPPDTYVPYDTYTPPPDTFVDDTSTGGGAPCIYCLGTCTDEILDEACFIDCISSGATDCSMSGTVCTCIP